MILTPSSLVQILTLPRGSHGSRAHHAPIPARGRRPRSEPDHDRGRAGGRPGPGTPGPPAVPAVRVLPHLQRAPADVRASTRRAARGRRTGGCGVPLRRRGHAAAPGGAAVRLDRRPGLPAVRRVRGRVLTPGGPRPAGVDGASQAGRVDSGLPRGAVARRAVLLPPWSDGAGHARGAPDRSGRRGARVEVRPARERPVERRRRARAGCPSDPLREPDDPISRAPRAHRRRLQDRWGPSVRAHV